MRRLAAIIFLALILSCSFFGQTDSVKPVNYKSSKIILASSGSILIAGSLVYLNQAWYSQYSSQGFHFFNDDKEWLQMDKAGHFLTTYQTGRLMMGAFRWAGFNKKQELFIGGATGFGYMTAIEVMDGFSSGWGFSWGDELANFLGASLAISQQAFWKEQRIQVKFSYSSSGFAKYNPSLLGKNFYTQILKDYNAQTYWLSINPSSFMKKDTKFPRWLNVAFGYGADGMIGGYANNTVVDANGNVLKFDRVRQYYFSLDLDLTRIKVRSKILKSFFSAVSILKFPFPALELSHGKLAFHPLYY